MPIERTTEAARPDLVAANTFGDPSRAQYAQIEGAFDYGMRTLFKALKIARGFERQKLGRRQKAAKEQKLKEDIIRFDTEVAALKNLDLALAAELHLYKTMLKTKSIASSSLLPSYIIPKVNASNLTTTLAYANVTARLYNSSPVKAAMLEVMSMVKERLGTKEIYHPSKKRKRAADFQRDVVSAEQQQPLASFLNNARDRSPTAVTQSDNQNQSQISHENSTASSSGAELEDQEQYPRRLASSSADEESLMQDVDDSADIGEARSTMRQSSFSPVPSQPPQQPRTKPSNPRNPNPSLKSTMLLPSLTLGGYWSNSDSVAPDSDSAAANIKTRKNRMGQQARRQLWEKKFGHNAFHLEKQSRDQGWDAKKGAQSRDEKRRGGRRRDGAGVGGRHRGSRTQPLGPSGANGDPVGPRRERQTAKAKPDGPLHPSWEAAKRKKESKQSVAFEGKKTVFD